MLNLQNLLVNPYSWIIKLIAIIVIIGAPAAYFKIQEIKAKTELNDLKKDHEQLQKVHQALVVATGVQNAEIQRLNEAGKKYNELLEAAAKKNSDERKASEKLIRDLWGQQVPKDCEGALRVLRGQFKSSAESWNKK